MRIALAVWDGRISPVFDTARSLLLIDVEKGLETGRREERLHEKWMPARAARLTALGVNTLLCGAISRPLSAMLASARVQVIPFLTGEVENVLKAYFDGELDDPLFQMPGCLSLRWGQGRRRRFRGGHGPRCW